jgi:hypothetical protein
MAGGNWWSWFSGEAPGGGTRVESTGIRSGVAVQGATHAVSQVLDARSSAAASARDGHRNTIYVAKSTGGGDYASG